MKTERSIAARERAVTRLKDLLSSAKTFGMPSSDLESRRQAIMEASCEHAPHWVKTYCDGYWAACIDHLYRRELVYGGFVDVDAAGKPAPYCGEPARFFSTHNSRPDYYEKNGIRPREWAEGGKVCRVGHYWIAHVDRGQPKAFYISAHDGDARVQQLRREIDTAIRTGDPIDESGESAGFTAKREVETDR